MGEEWAAVTQTVFFVSSFPHMHTWFLKKSFGTDVYKFMYILLLSAKVYQAVAT